MDRKVAVSAPIQEDILVQIFLSLSKYMERVYAGMHGQQTVLEWDWICVTEVCGYWRTVAIETPVLWSYIHMFRSSKRTKRLLLMSKNSDLTVHYDQSLRNYGNATFKNLKIVLEEMPRIRHLWLNLSDFDEVSQLPPLLDQIAPRAESIVMLLPYRFIKKTRCQIPLGSPGILKTISLCGANLLSSMTRIAGLSSLSIRYSINFSLSELLQVFEACPELASLTLSKCDIGSSVVPMPVRLHCLSSLDLQCMPFLVCCSLIQSIEVPNIQSWSIIHIGDVAPDDVSKIDTFSKLLQGEFSCKTIHLSVICGKNGPLGRITLYKDSRFDLFGYNKKADLGLSFESVDLNIILSRLTEISSVDLEKAERLDVGIPDNSITVDTWYRTLNTSGFAMTINCSFGYMCGSHGLFFLEALRRSTPRSFSVAEMPCPLLECLEIRWFGKDHDLDLLIGSLEDIVRTRSTYGFPVRKISVLSLNSVPKSEEFEKLSTWVQELEWETTNMKYGLY